MKLSGDTRFMIELAAYNMVLFILPILIIASAGTLYMLYFLAVMLGLIFWTLTRETRNEEKELNS